MTATQAGGLPRAALWSSLALLAGLLGCDAPADDPATLAFIETRVWTGDPDRPWAEAVAVRGERIVTVGSSEEIAPLIGDETRVLTLTDGMLVPGFIDAHVHLVAGGAALASVQLRDAATPEEFVARIAAFAKALEPGEWILGGTWDHENWGGELPQRAWIDEVTPDNPVWIMRLDGHMGLANSRALEIAGVGADTADIDGGEIVRDAVGVPTGVLKDNAMSLVTETVPPAGAAMRAAQARTAMRHVAAHGITTVHDMAESSREAWANIATYRELHERGELITRVHPHPPITDWQRLADEIEARGRGDDWLRLGGLKAFMDGSLGSHTAAFFEPFTDAPDDSGLLLNEADDMRRWIRDADAAGLQLAIHAIGDRAVSNLLDMYLETVEQNGLRDRRFRIEHAQHVHPSDLRRFARQDVIASMQPYHAIDDGRWAEKVIGAERAKTTYAFRSLLDAGTRVAFGSDWYVAPADPLAGIYAAVTRRTLDGANPDGWVPEQKITVEEALRAYTVEAAYATFDENSKGMIRPGMLADLVLVDRDLTAIAPQDIREANILLTVVGGDVVFDSSETESD